MSLQDVETLIGVSDNRLMIIYNSIERRLLAYLNANLQDDLALYPLAEIPEELGHIVTEATIVRFNRLGSEGLTEESVEGHTAKYVQADEFTPYIDEIHAYIERQVPTGSGVVRFL